jgi:hypothetical protein
VIALAERCTIVLLMGNHEEMMLAALELMHMARMVRGQSRPARPFKLMDSPTVVWDRSDASKKRNNVVQRGFAWPRDGKGREGEQSFRFYTPDCHLFTPGIYTSTLSSNSLQHFTF